jgi:cephalosporin-C deacetylase-like acetyl esterase
MRRSTRLGFRLSYLIAIVLVAIAAHAAEFTGPWNLSALKKTPPASWGQKSGPTQEVYYEGEWLDGKPTRVFAYYARPESGEGPFPAMVLVHGGGGAAFPQWAALWAKRGYAAIAMDLAGCGPGGKRLPDGGPPQDDHTKFRKFTDQEATQMWTYHAVAAVVRGHSLLASRKEVDAARIGITGISWGGYLTSIVAGIDDRLKLAVPVYGCGFLHENSVWLDQFKTLGPEHAAHWVSYFDPSRYLPGVRCPIFFVNGTNDFAYPLDSYQKSYRLVPGPRSLRIEVQMPHGHEQGWAPKEIGLFADSILKGGEPLPALGPMKTTDGRATATCTAKVPVVKAALHYTTDSGRWQDRKWRTVEAKIEGNTVLAELPKDRPLVCYLSVVDQRQAMVSTEHADIPSP